MVLAFLFFSILLLMCEFAFFKTKRDIISPAFIYFAIFALSAFVFAINYYTWDMPFHADTMFILLLGIAMFGVGCAAASYCRDKSRGKFALGRYARENVPYNVKSVSLSTRAVVISSEIVAIADIWTLLDSYRLSILAGNENGIFKMVPYVRQIILYTTADLQTSFLLKQLKYFSMAIAFFYIFAVLYDAFYLKKKLRFSYFIPPALEIVQMVMTTGRIIFLRVIIFVLITAIILYRKKHGWNKTVIKKFLKYALIGGVAFIVLFRLAGMLTGKSSKFNFYDNISLYLGGSLPAFDDYLHFFHDTNNEFGAETLINFQRIFYKLHIIDYYHNSALDWMTVYNMSFNTYTAIRRYFHDFGYAGMAVIQAAIGYFYTRFYLFVSKKDKGIFWLFIYGFIIYPVFLSFDDDLFFISVFSTATITEIVYMALIYWFFIGRRQPKQKWLLKITAIPKRLMKKGENPYA